MTVYRCPHCNSRNLHRSSRRGVFENFVLLPFLLRPYRCHSCTRRHYGYVFREGTASGVQAWARPIRRTRALLSEAPPFGMPLLFVNSGPVLRKQSD